MKALSLWQPWATLVAIKAKQIETRPGTFRFQHRGELAIHAAKHWTSDLKVTCLFSEEIRKALTPLALAQWPDRSAAGALAMYLDHAGGPKGLPLGCIVARTQLNGVYRSEDVWKKLDEVFDLREIAFGDYAPGRKAIDLGPTVAVREPIPYRGAQGLFTIDDTTAERIRASAPWPWEAAKA